MMAAWEAWAKVNQARARFNVWRGSKKLGGSLGTFEAREGHPWNKEQGTLCTESHQEEPLHSFKRGQERG